MIKTKIAIAIISSLCFVACSYDYGLPEKKDEIEVVKTEDITVPANMIFAHPGLLHSQSDFDRMKAKVAAEIDPWISGYNKLISNSHASANYVMKGPVVKLIRGGGSREEPAADNYGAAMQDAHAAYLTAIRWKITGDVAYANKSIQILNAWAATCTSISGDSNKALAAGIYGYQFANAAEIMRDYSGWNVNDFGKFKKWMLDVFYTENYQFLQTHYNNCNTVYWANWDLCNLASIMSIAVLNDDVYKYTYVIDYLMKGAGNGQLKKAINYIHPKSSNDDIDLGQIQESGRDQGHTLMVIGMLGSIAQMGENQGLDIYGYNDNMILKGAEYVAKFNAARLSVPFTTYTNCVNETHTTAADDAGRGQIRPVWERIYNHYTKDKGITARYIKIAKDIGYPEGGSGDLNPNSGGYDDLGFGTLLYSK